MGRGTEAGKGNMETMKDVSAYLPAHKHMATMASPTKLGDPRQVLCWYLLLKYLQVLVLPEGNDPVLALGALASWQAARLLSSPRVSCKASNVLLSQLALADALLPVRWGLAVLPSVAAGIPGVLAQGLLGVHHHASSLLLGCLSLEVLLVKWWAQETRRLRTARCARLLSAAIWAATLAEQLLLQVVGHSLILDQGPVLRTCLLAVPLLCSFTSVLKGALWLANTWVYYMIFSNSSLGRKNCFR